MKKIRVAIVGFGGIARIHYNAYMALIEEGLPLEIVAICEKNKESVRKKVTINLGTDTLPVSDDIEIFGDVDELIEKADFDLADVCLPTFLHKNVSIKLLEAGKHVLCEKPMALSSADCLEMISAADTAKRGLMIAQCLRYEPCYLYLKECFESKMFGDLKYVTMYRLSEYPRWSPAFADNNVTGGCALDTHIHDIDVARHIFGDPASVSATEFVKMPFCQHINSRLDYNGFKVLAECCWDEARAKPFEAGYRAFFENATLVCEGEDVTVYENGKEPYAAEFTKKDRIVEEIRSMLDAIDSEEGCGALASGAYKSVVLIERLRESAAAEGQTVKL